jgi:ABC-type Na+ efflux pump permease subunit
MIIALCLILALIWGAVWAALLQFTRWGRFMALKRAWLAVVIGVGVDLLLLSIFLPLTVWVLVFGIFGASSVGIIIRSLANEWRDLQEFMEGLNGNPDQAGK